MSCSLHGARNMGPDPADPMDRVCLVEGCSWFSFPTVDGDWFSAFISDVIYFKVPMPEHAARRGRGG